MASYPQNPPNSPKPSPAIFAPPGRITRPISSRSQTPYPVDRPTFSSLIPQNNQGSQRPHSLSKRPKATSITSSRSITPAYQSSPPLPACAPRHGISLRSAPGPTSSANHKFGGEWQEDSDNISGEGIDVLNEIIMAVDMKDRGPRGSTIGCAYYSVLEEALYLLEDVQMAGIDLVETLLLHAQPTTMLISSRTPEPLAQLLARGSQDVNGNQELPGAYILRTLNSTDFRYEVGKNKLADLHIEMGGSQSMVYATVVDNNVLEDQDRGSRQGQLMRLATLINLDSPLSIGCAGAVLSDIQRRRTIQYLPHDPDALAAFGVRSVQMFSLFNSMFVNADTLVSLQIMQSEYHPNSHQRGPTGATSGAKESLSVYGLFSHLAVTPQGKLKLRRMFLQPSIDIDLIRERQWTISFFLRPGNADTLYSISKDLRKIKDMKSVVMLLRKGIDSVGRKITVANSVWAMLQKFAAYSLQLRESLRVLPDAKSVDIIQKVIQIIDPIQIRQVGELITETIDPEQSVDRGRIAVKQGIDADLDERKRAYDGMESFLATVITKLQSTVPEWARKYVKNCIFFPQLGFLTVVSINPQTGKGNYDGEGLNETWMCMFIADGSAYYKNQQMKELDEELGDLYCMIIDREIEIIHQLAVTVLDRETAIIEASEVLGELDSLVALATLCGQNEWTAPQMTTANIIDIQGGRHPLQELVTPSFIPNDCSIAGGIGNDMHENADASPSVAIDKPPDSPSTVIITGPNHSGKSVYLKQIATIVYLAHIGCFVPAEHAQIGITDRILTRISTRESVARSESAFAIDLRQVAFAINFATRRSLIIIDEFGKGTNSQDGAGLMTAAISHFTGLGNERPKLLVATHFHEILNSEFLIECAELAFAHMKIHIDLDSSTVEDQVTYLYQFALGRSISSFGSRCAAMNGVGQAIVERAESIILQMVRHEDLEVVCSKLSDTETQKLEEAEDVARAFLEEDFIHPPTTTPKSELEHWYRSKLVKMLSPAPPFQGSYSTD
ncbi:putative MSH5 protein [Xylaria bambusicola]|uniref:putative MSH5 protein n=1 Tax=Xylaria bambusicola TaxID=326684 RepID=UPI0020078D0F|nr:putative MSH5 protein [Xylaria bambusicola]KAI0508600.1 putative MSH5 protein [Xylaria bambusicola]